MVLSTVKRIHSKVKRAPWTLDDAVAFVRRLEPLIHPRHYAALAGSVLITGRSEHDLDLVIYPHDSRYRGRGSVDEAMRSLGYRLAFDRDDVHAFWQARGSGDRKHVETWLSISRPKKRVDLFFLR